MPTSDELEAWRQQPMYDGEPFSQDRQFEVATAAFLGDATYELHTYASVYMENWGLDLQLEMPTPEKLARWVHDEQCPHAELVISEERLQRLFQGQARWFTLADDTGTAMAVLLGPTEDFSLGRFIDVFRLWREATEEFRTAWRHPLAPLMKAWFISRPRQRMPPRGRRNASFRPKWPWHHQETAERASCSRWPPTWSTVRTASWSCRDSNWTARRQRCPWHCTTWA